MDIKIFFIVILSY